MKKISRKLYSFFIALIFIFVSFFYSANVTRAWLGMGDISIDPVNTSLAGLQNSEIMMQYVQQLGNDMKEWAIRAAVNAIKKAALDAVQGNLKTSSKSKMITDYGKYLYDDPMNKTSRQMDIFYNQATRGTSASINYEGVGGGPSYGNYLKAQAQGSVNGVDIQVSITDVVSDPTKPFSSGNMQGMMSFLECGNNPYCFSIVAQSKHDQLLTKNQEIAKAEQVNGFMPTKQNGIIVAPSFSAASQYASISQMGVDAIVSAINNDSSVENIIRAGVSYVTQITDETGQASTEAPFEEGYTDDYSSQN